MPTFAANAAVFDGGEVLLIKRRDLEVWALPGGAIDAGESAAQSAMREVFEETGIRVELTHLVGVYSRPRWRAGGDHDLVFAARPLSDTISTQTEEVLEAAYFPPSRLPEPLIWWDRERINDAVNGFAGVARLQDSRWPFEPEDDVRRKLADSQMAPSEFYEAFCTKAGPQREVIEAGVKLPSKTSFAENTTS